MPVVNFLVKFFIVIFSVVLFLYIVGRISYPGAIGFRPIDDGCYGVAFENKEVYDKFPEGKIWLKSFNFEYYVPKKIENKSPKGFCLGKNFWDKKRREAEVLENAKEKEKSENFNNKK